MDTAYNYRNCQSLFGYAAKVHRRCHWTCELCGCGGKPVNFDLWRQLTVEHVIGESQGGYLKDLRPAVAGRFPSLSKHEQDAIVLAIDEVNTVTACSFCNSMTSRDRRETSMVDLLSVEGDRDQVMAHVQAVIQQILDKKRETVRWKLVSVRDAFERLIRAD